MLQNIRAGIQGTAARVIIGLIVISFAIFGIESILVGTSGDDVAEVNGEPIRLVEVQQLVNNQKRRLLAAMGDAVDPSLLDDARLSQQALQSLVQRRVLSQQARELGLTLSDEALGRLIADMEEFQAGGQFSPELYRNALSMAGYTPSSFQETLRNDIVTSHLQLGIAGSEFVTPAELQLAALYDREQRDLRYLVLPRTRFLPEEPFSEDAYTAYYADNSEQFRAGEAVELEYIELTLDDFVRPIDEERLREYWLLERDDYVVPDEYWVSHILFTAESGESREQTLERVNAVRESLLAGADFSEAARDLSRDAGSARSGGQLGFTTGDIFPAPMESAIASLTEGDISEPVRTDAGWHLIRVDEIRSGEAPEFDDVRDELEQRLQEQQARDALITTVERLKDLVFNAEDLRGPARELELTVERSERVYRDQASGLFANPQLNAAAFSDDVLQAGYNSDVFELADSRHVVLRVLRYHEPQILPLDDVREQISTLLTNAAVTSARETMVAELKARLASGDSMDQLAQEYELEWQVALGATRDDREVPRQLLQRVFALVPPAEGEENTTYFEFPGADAYLVQLVRASAGDLARLPEMERAMLRSRLGGELGRLIDDSYRRSLVDAAKIKTL